MEFTLLGPVAVRVGEDELPLGPVKRRSVLALLLLQPNAVVPVQQFIDALWEDEPPEHARTVVQGHVSRLRAVLAEGDAAAYGVELSTHGAAYRLAMPPGLLDADRFGELSALARPEESPEEAEPLLEEALALWRGPALTGTVPSPPFAAAAHALDERRLAAVEALGRAQAAQGHPEKAAALLYEAAVANPLREGLIAALMRTLCEAERQSDAIAWYHRTRRLLNEELGIDPGPRLSAAYEEILRADRTAAPARPARPAAARPARPAGRTPGDGASGDGPRPGNPYVTPAPAAGAPADGGSDGRGRPAAEPGSDTAGGTSGAGAPAAPPTPRLLPRPPARFLGRTEALAALDEALLPEGAPVGGLAVVSGPAGVGKTACAVQWAHHRASAFPDGQLFADLRGFGVDEPPKAVDILAGFLDALGVPAERVPTSADAAAALFRSLAADRRLLVVLDNARDSAQVRPLLSGGTRCATVVTSRSRLDGLVVTDAARAVRVPVLGAEEGIALLGAMLGTERIEDDPEAARELVELCDGLPLALRAAAAQLAARPRWRLARLAAALRDERRRLALLSAEDTGVATALRMSVARLSVDDAKVLSALGTWLGDGSGHSGDAVVDASAAAAAMSDISPDLIEESLERLVDMHLLDEEATNRYVMSELVKLFTQEALQAREEEKRGRAGGADEDGSGGER